jgi:hypothetical protein
MTVDPLVVLERVVARYRRDVHHLAGPAPAEAITALEGHLAQSLPLGLRAVLARHNGGLLFRGTLRLRAAAEMALASAGAPRVVLFADGQAAGVAKTFGESDLRWAFSPDGRDGHVFGTWDGRELTAMHTSFGGWLAGTVAVIETRAAQVGDAETLRFDADPDDPVQLALAGERLLAQGQGEEAAVHLRRATEVDPGSAAAWSLLGDALSATDRQSARMAWLAALRATRLPAAWPGAPLLDGDLFRRLTNAFSTPEEWEQQLERFLTDQARDVVDARELAIVVGAAAELARSREQRGHRSSARQALGDVLARCRLFRYKATPWSLLLDLARLETDLGHHDEAEMLLRRLRRPEPGDVPSNEEIAEGALALGRIAVMRQEPWAEEILDEALAGGLSDPSRVEALVLRAERAIRYERVDEARQWVGQARAAAQRVAIRQLQALVFLADADVLRLEGNVAGARDALERASRLLADRWDDPEIRLRIQLRQGDLCVDDRPADAWRLYQSVARGFAECELPVREGWALLRLARVASDPQPILDLARQRFTASDLAAGVAAVDAVRGDPGASLPWHLERSAAQARARYDAQRGRLPWERPDADRPERRLGAHRLAIAACSDKIVTSLARELDACARAMSAGRGRALDPPVMQYVAAVDLLGAHRSYAAAQVLLEHLLRGPADGTARKALQGAIVRSGNAALVDGLLSCVEGATSWPADAVAAAAEILGLRREREALPALVALAAPRSNPISRKAAVAALGRLGERSVVDTLLPALDEPSLAEQAAIALLLLGDRRGVDFHGRALSQNRNDLSSSPGEIVGRYGGPAYLLLLVNASEGTDDRALGALQGLGLMGEPRGVPALLAALSARDRKVVEVAAGALQILTGHLESVEETGLARRWKEYWETEQHRFRSGVRHRDGTVFDPAALLVKMDHDDPWVRRTAFDEMAITTGGQLPFDADGPWRVQRAHLRAWHRWWATHRHAMAPGRWYLDGAPIS